MSKIDEDEYMSQIGSEVEKGMEWTQELLDSAGITNWAFPIAPGMPHRTGVAQRRPWPVGHFKTPLVKPILPFLTTLYLRARLIHQLARNVHVFHMQSIYIARQALHLVILLNDAVDANEGPSDEQDDERNDLEDDLIELSKAMDEWGSDKGDDFEYERQATEIEHQYAQLFQQRFYFYDARDCSTDPVYQRFVAYDAKTIRYRQRRETHMTSPTTIEIECWTETVEDESGSEDDTRPRFDSNIGSLPPRLGQHTVEGPPVFELHPSMLTLRPGDDAQSAWLRGSECLARKPLRLAPKSRSMIKKDHPRKRKRAVTAFRIHLAINQLHMVQIGARKLVRRDSRRWRVSSLPSCSMSPTPPASSASMLLTSPTNPPNTAMISPSSPPIPGTLPVSPAHSVPENSSESAGPQGVLLSTLEDLMEGRKASELAGKMASWGEPEPTATHTTTYLRDLEIIPMYSPDSLVVEPGSRMNLNLPSFGQYRFMATMLAAFAAPPIPTPTSIDKDFGDFDYIGGDAGFDGHPLGLHPSVFGGKSNGISTNSGDTDESHSSPAGSSGSSNHELAQHLALDTPITTAAKHRHHSSGANTSISSVHSSGQSQSISVSPDPMPTSPGPTTAIPLRVRVNALPKDKCTMFERAAGELWNPREEHHHEEGLAHSQAVFLEDLYALIASDQLRDQIEIPDDLVEPILKTMLLPRADAHKGSRGGSAGHLCLWAGCGKTIKRLDHSRKHIREHCKSKPHSCGGQGSRGCGQTFLRMDDLKRHQKSHCSVLRSGPGRRPRSIRGTRRDTDVEEEKRGSEDSTSLNGGDGDDYRPIYTREDNQRY